MKITIMVAYIHQFLYWVVNVNLWWWWWWWLKETRYWSQKVTELLLKRHHWNGTTAPKHFLRGYWTLYCVMEFSKYLIVNIRFVRTLFVINGFTNAIVYLPKTHRHRKSLVLLKMYIIKYFLRKCELKVY